MKNAEIELQALITEREAMVALNMQRAALGQSMAYNDGHFFQLAEDMRKLKEDSCLVKIKEWVLGQR